MEIFNTIQSKSNIVNENYTLKKIGGASILKMIASRYTA